MTNYLLSELMLLAVLYATSYGLGLAVSTYRV